MDRRDFLKSVFSATAISGLSGCIDKSTKVKAETLSNFLFILVDDLGWADLGCYGSDFYETPNIDVLANEGMKFTNAYAASPVCSPTRASIHSGKYPARMGINFILNDGLVSPTYRLRPPRCETEMKLSEVTFAEVLKRNGYKTFFAGKWHLGEEEKYYPQHQGFDINIGGHKGGQPASYFYPYQSDNDDGYFDVPDLESGKPGEYLTDRLTDETIHFIKKNTNNRFMAFLSFYSVHTPLEGKPEIVVKYQQKAQKMGIADDFSFLREEKACDDYRTPEVENYSKSKLVQNNAVYAAMIQSVDENIGELMNQLKKSGLDKKTVVVFFSDNGGFSTHTHRPIDKLSTSNVPLRAGKGWLYEGGIREPLIIRWPGVTAPASVCDEPVISTDFYPTILEIAGLPLMPHQHMDGLSLVPLLRGRQTLNREAIYWHMPHYHSSGISPCGAIRMGDFKLIEYFEDGRAELYNLKEDLQEVQDLSEKYPDKVKMLKDHLKNWRDDVNAAMPTQTSSI